MNETETTCMYCKLPIQIGKAVVYEHKDGLGFYVHPICKFALIGQEQKEQETPDYVTVHNASEARKELYHAVSLFMHEQ